VNSGKEEGSLQEMEAPIELVREKFFAVIETPE